MIAAPTIKPFLKWVGGKQRLIHALPIPRKFNSYHEPFLGGGAMLLHLLQQNPNLKAIGSDSNAELIDLWINVRDNCRNLKYDYERLISQWNAGNDKFRYEMYNDIRENYNSLASCLYKSALFLFLNKTCFNGLYRVNKKGQFNVPMGRYKFVTPASLEPISRLIQNVEFLHQHFEYTEFNVDFVYLDPPYTPATETANFTQFTSDFDLTCTENLIRRWVVSYHGYVLISNNDVYPWNIPIDGFKTGYLDVRKNISCQSRDVYKEVIIYNY